MVPRRPRSLLILWVLLVPVLAGCLEGEASLEPDDMHTDDRDDLQDVVPSASHVLMGDHNLSLAPWLAESPPELAGPEHAGMVQVAGYNEDDVLLRLLFDGAAFVLTGRPLADAAFDDAVFVARIVTAGPTSEVARNHTHLIDGREGLAMELPTFVQMRMGASYRLEVYGFHWDGNTAWCTESCGAERDPIGSLVHGRTAVMSEPGPPEVRPIVVWQTRLSLTSRAMVTLDGPSEATDRPDAVESKYALGPETGTYTVNVTGVRIWRADLLLEFQDSRIHATRPEAFGNGSSSLDVFLSGHRPLDAWRGLPADEGFEQSFTLEVDIDHETGNGDLPQDGQQYFFATLQHGYRIDGGTYIAGSSGADLGVDVRAE